MSESYKVKNVMFASLKNGGHMQVKELVDYPGISITDTKKDRKSDWTREIAFGDRKYNHIDDAISDWKREPAKGAE